MQRTLLRIVWCTFLLFPSLLSLHAEDFWQDTLWIRKLPYGGKTFTKVLFHPDGKSVFTASDKYFYRYDVQSGEILKLIELKNGGYIGDFALTKDNRVIFACDQLFDKTFHSTIEIWDLDNGFIRGYQYEPIPSFNDPTGSSVGLSPNDSLLYVGRASDYGIHVIRLSDGKEIHNEKGYSWLMSISPDGKYVATNGTKNGDSYGVLLDAMTWELVSTFPLLYLPKFDNSGRYIAGRDYQNKVILYDREENQSYPLVGHKGELFDVCFTDDGKYILSVSMHEPSDNGGYRVWSVDTKKLHYLATWYFFNGQQIAVSRTGRYIASSTNNAIALIKSPDFLVGVNDQPPFGEGDKNITITPNPTQSFIQITFPIGTSSGDYTISDINGKNILHGNLTNEATQSGKTMVDVSSLHNGMFTCTLTIGTFSYSSSFIINR